MSYLCRFLCVCALGLAPLSGCSDSTPDPCNGIDCDDRNECTEDLCSSTDGSCSNTALSDGSICDAGSCESGSCQPIDSIFPCTEQGIRDAIARGRGPHAFDCDRSRPVLTRAEIVINNDVILDGERKLTVDANFAGLPIDDWHSVFRVAEGVNAELRRLTVTGGAPPPCVGMCFGSGGGISNRGTLTLTDTTVTNNGVVSPADSYGVFNWGAVTLTRCTISDNIGGIFQFQRAGGDGGPSTLTITDSTLSSNEEFTILNHGGTVSMANSTLSFAGESSGIRTARGLGSGAVTVTFSTLSSSGMPSTPVISVEDDSPPLKITATVIVGGCSGDVESNGYNIESPGNTCGFDQEGDQPGVSAVALELQPLADNGGPTMTLAITTDSAAFNTGTCEVTTDQRGVTRPQGDACDVGAFELEVGP